jgi:N-acyl-D-aspartate/D-glutamate deacylase
VADMATYDEPTRYSVGVTHVVVNGRLVLDGGKLTSERPGRLLRPASRACRPVAR